MLPPGEFTARLNGLDIWFKISGKGPPCIPPTPGWGPSSDLYFRTLSRLEITLTMIYVDTRGTGRSQKPPHHTDYTLGHFSADIESLRQHLEIPTPWIMGHSRAGIHAAHFALNYPESVAGLVLVDPLAEKDDAWRADTESRMLLRRGEPWYERARKAWDDDTFPADDAAFAANEKACLAFYFSDVSKMETASSAFSATTFSVEALRGARSSIPGEFGVLQALTRIRIPALILVGEDDFITSPLQAQRLHSQISASELHVIPAAGHFPWIEQPGRLFEIVEAFIAKNRSAAA